MNENVLNSEAIEQFKKLIHNVENMNKDLDCYTQLMKELIVKSYCPN